MPKKWLNRLICTSVFLMVTNSQVEAKFYYSLSSYKIDRIEYKHTLKQYNSDVSFVNYKNRDVGEGTGRNLRYFFSNKGSYLLVFLTKKRKESDELIVYTTANFKELYRLKVGKFLRETDQNGFPYLYPPIFDNDNVHVLVQTQQKKGASKIKSLRLNDGELNYSIDIEKGYIVESKSAKGNLLFIVKKGVGNGPVITIAKSIKIYNITTGKILNSFEMKKSYKFGRKVFSFLDDSFSVIVSIHKLKSVYKYRLLVLDTKTGKIIQEYDAGGASPVQVKDKDDRNKKYLLLAKKQKLEIVKFEKSQFQEILRYDDSFEPKNLIINSNKDKFLIIGRSKMILVDMDDMASSKKIKAPFDIGSGFFASDDNLIYIREGYGSEVAIIDFKNKKLINSSSTGRSLVKFGNFMAIATGSMIVGYYNPNYFYYSNKPFWFFEPDTSMLLANKSKKLYVVNKGTNDVSIFESESLSNKKIISTGNGTLGVFMLTTKDKKQENVIVLSENSINYFDKPSSKHIKKIKFRRFLSVDFKNNLLFVEGKDRETYAYYLDSGKVFEKLYKSKSLEKLFYFQSY